MSVRENSVCSEASESMDATGWFRCVTVLHRDDLEERRSIPGPSPASCFVGWFLPGCDMDCCDRPDLDEPGPLAFSLRQGGL